MSLASSRQGRSLELYFIDGRPDGMLTAEVFNWTGHVLMAPRTQIAEALQREEAGYTGVYLLLGERDGVPLAYIGEGEIIADRIRMHDSKRDWWTKAVLVTTGANNPSSFFIIAPGNRARCSAVHPVAAPRAVARRAPPPLECRSSARVATAGRTSSA